MPEQTRFEQIFLTDLPAARYALGRGLELLELCLPEGLPAGAAEQCGVEAPGEPAGSAPGSHCCAGRLSAQELHAAFQRQQDAYGGLVAAIAAAENGSPNSEIKAAFAEWSGACTTLLRGLLARVDAMAALYQARTCNGRSMQHTRPDGGTIRS